MLRPALFAALTLAVGCAPGLDDPAFPTGSSTVASNHRHLATYATDAFDGTLTAMSNDGARVSQLDLGGEPTRVARVGDQLWVTQRATRTVAIVDARGTELSLDRQLEVGAEPYGVVATEDGSRVYVAMSQDDEVWEFDGHSREVLRTWSVPDEPRWLALHPSEQALAVVSAFEATITRIDLRDGSLHPVEHPEVTRPVEGGEVELTPRNTGDPSFSPTGDMLAVPVLFVDIQTPVDDPEIDEGGDVEPPSSGGGYSSAGTADTELSIGRMNPAIVAFPFDEKDGHRILGERTLPVFVGSNTSDGQIRGYVSSARVAPSGTEVVATLESADAVAVVSLLPFEGQGMARSRTGHLGRPPRFDRERPPFIRPARGGFFERPQVIVTTADQPTGVGFTANGSAMVYASGARSLLLTDLDRVQEDLEIAVTEPEAFEAELEFTRSVRDEFVVGAPTLPEDVERGRKLFFSATSPSMAAAGAGVSCSTCHLESRNDGLTWTFEDGVRQTPSLAGEVSRTAPVTWTNDVESVGREAQITSAGRMGGHGLSDEQADAIGAFVDWTRAVDVGEAGLDASLVDLGSELFYREDVGCGSCHSGAEYTDNRFHDLYGLRGVNTPTLVGIAATAPYLHDGSAKTLRDVLETSRAGLMGDTSMLSDHEMDALEAFLRSR